MAAVEGPAGGRGVVEMTVTARRDVSEGVVELELDASESGGFLDWTPGAHIELVLPSGLVRQYSLCGDDLRRNRVRIAVLRETQGRGGSLEVHRTLAVGTTVGVRGPRNHFELVESDEYLFVAGGIGITPILAMVREVGRAGRRWHLVYGGRTRRSMAYLDELEDLARRSGGTGVLTVVPEDELGYPDLCGLLSGASRDTVLYACGPEGLLSALEALSAELLESGRLHLERFQGSGQAAHPAADGALDGFEVEIASTGQVLTVGPDDSLLDVVRAVAPDVPFSCREGWCGACETVVLAGRPCHRDEVLNDDERERSATMMICVGRSLDPRLVLDL
ncbi:PDR/VanB family oxidoreductase [Pseudonocardia ailaonensis]|uniref:PDR/VanB family oxidoreductase n=1 Tax=Pseudonocardia ailaonensis TaxID=367279 RepID=A0ABN2N469_9PSEU